MVRFTELDGYILWCLPDPGSDLASWIRTYMFIGRTAAPSYDEMAGCVRRSARAGVIPPPADGRYQLTPEWRRRVHQWGAGAAIPEEGMIAFAERLSSDEWPVIFPAGCPLDRKQYESATAGHPRRV